jgi:hypothetical protein
VRGFETSADDYVTKPFSVSELVARVAALLRRMRPLLVADVLTVGDIELNRTAMSVLRRGQTIHLGPTDYRMLEFFMQAPGRVFTRGQLLDGVWGNEVYIDERTVDVHIGRLRKGALIPFAPCAAPATASRRAERLQMAPTACDFPQAGKGMPQRGICGLARHSLVTEHRHDCVHAGSGIEEPPRLKENNRLRLCGSGLLRCLLRSCGSWLVRTRVTPSAASDSSQSGGCVSPTPLASRCRAGSRLRVAIEWKAAQPCGAAAGWISGLANCLGVAPCHRAVIRPDVGFAATQTTEAWRC